MFFIRLSYAFIVSFIMVHVEILSLFIFLSLEMNLQTIIPMHDDLEIDSQPRVALIGFPMDHIIIFHSQIERLEQRRYFHFWWINSALFGWPKVMTEYRGGTSLFIMAHHHTLIHNHEPMHRCKHQISSSYKFQRISSECFTHLQPSVWEF